MPPIVLVENDEDDIEILMECLNPVDRELVVHLAGSTRELLPLLDRIEAPGLLLMDLFVPPRDTIECIGRVKSGEKWKATPIVVVSILDSPQLKDACLLAGASEYHPTPVVFAGWQKLVNGLLARYYPTLLVSCYYAFFT